MNSEKIKKLRQEMNRSDVLHVLAGTLEVGKLACDSFDKMTAATQEQVIAAVLQYAEQRSNGTNRAPLCTNLRMLRVERRWSLGQTCQELGKVWHGNGVWTPGRLATIEERPPARKGTSSEMIRALEVVFEAGYEFLSSRYVAPSE